RFCWRQQDLFSYRDSFAEFFTTNHKKHLVIIIYRINIPRENQIPVTLELILIAISVLAI
ncbi:hypothetical protein, partial [Bacillus cereus]|uniref:hypothetical protein n=1 Tax=Bacillus cereus TaxID=1396 RepID=UPI001EE6FA7D